MDLSNLEFLKLLLTAASIVFSLIVVCLTAYLSLRKLYTEKWWEKKLQYFISQTDAAYLLHRSVRYWRDKHGENKTPGLYKGFILLTKNEENDLNRQHVQALAELDKFSHMGTMLTSKKSTELIKVFLENYNNILPKSWEDNDDEVSLTSATALSSDLLDGLVLEAKNELKIKNGKRFKFFSRKKT
ncbi:hypothetical protein [Pantoea agglomerans]|uniref:hypothetical protein n=1 Tax=Enterobacter agglomerans TaxID=549 RepID=UPI001654831A|nr:hypothetical protein [Pantoea agglomerans]